jgi:hypothetical protein
VFFAFLSFYYIKKNQVENTYGCFLLKKNEPGGSLIVVTSYSIKNRNFRYAGRSGLVKLSGQVQRPDPPAARRWPAL